jgi:predicted aminopeptidase
LAYVAGALTLIAGGCSSFGYYAQAAHGHFSMLAAARPIDDWLADPATTDSLRDRLRLAREIRGFAVSALALPDNRSYTMYADLHRPAVVWNVFATPELSMQLKTWCYPLFGCAGYRGYFDQRDAEALAADLRAQDYEVNVSPVSAYSTLGWFADPLLNTFIDGAEADLARLIFHELAHQVVYANNDTVFNESFATAVEREGVRRWLAQRGDAAAAAAVEQQQARRADFLALLLDWRRRLKAVYDGPLSPSEKRTRKRALFAELRADYERVKKERWGGYAGYDRFFARELNNAHLAAVGAYNEWVPAFDALLTQVDRDLPRFYAEVKRLAALAKDERQLALETLSAGSARASVSVD